MASVRVYISLPLPVGGGRCVGHVGWAWFQELCLRDTRVLLLVIVNTATGDFAECAFKYLCCQLICKPESHFVWNWTVRVKTADREGRFFLSSVTDDIIFLRIFFFVVFNHLCGFTKHFYACSHAYRLYCSFVCSSSLYRNLSLDFDMQ